MNLNPFSYICIAWRRYREQAREEEKKKEEEAQIRKILDDLHKKLNERKSEKTF